MKKWLRLLVWVGLVAYLVAAFGFVAENNKNAVCESIKVTILDSAVNQFLKKNEVMDLILDDKKEILGQKFAKINMKEIETIVNNQAFVKDAQIFATIEGILNIELSQRIPIVRVVNGKRESYYIDKEGVIFPLSKNYTSRVLIANGYIFEPFDKSKQHKLAISDKDMNSRERVIYDLFTLAEYIYGNELWRAQFAQIYVNSKYEFELIPKVGAHVIYFGDISDYKEKFRKLEVMYFHGFSNTGWNQYHTVNLKFKNQVVCTKR